MRAGLLGVLSLSLAASVQADELSECVGIRDDPVRLACYDRLAHRDAEGPTATLATTVTDPQSATPVVVPAPLPPSPVSMLSERWELDPASKTGTFQFRAHNPTYLLPFYTTSSVNGWPTSPAPGHTPAAARDQQASEVKFQISFKTKLAEDLFDGRSDLWFGYTQKSWWQLYNSATSADFRETNYAPELILTTRTDYDLFGWRGRMVNLGLLHESNGRDLPLSRSWNRVYVQAGLERGNWVLLVRPWWRVPESSSNDDNPDITRYMGHGDVIAMWKNGGHVVSLLGRYNPATGKGGAQADWAFPIWRQLKGYVQVFSGYGDSLIDYNHSQTTLGIGISLSDGL